MRIDKITFHGVEQFNERRAATILMTNGVRLNAWYYPGTYALSHVNSLPRVPDDKRAIRNHGIYHRTRNLECAHGRKLAADFKAYAEEHEAAAIKAIEDEKARKEQERLAAVAKQQEERLQAVAAVILQTMAEGPRSSINIARALMDAGFIDRNG